MIARSRGLSLSRDICTELAAVGCGLSPAEVRIHVTAAGFSSDEASLCSVETAVSGAQRCRHGLRRALMAMCAPSWVEGGVGLVISPGGGW